MKLVQKVGKVTSINPRKEHHGENLALALDVSLEVNTEKDVLDQFDKDLGGFLFGKHGPRYPELGEVAWSREYENATVKLNTTELKGCKIRKIKVKPEPGDSVKLAFMVTLYPSEETVGHLSAMIQEQVAVDVDQTHGDLVDDAKKDKKAA